MSDPHEKTEALADLVDRSATGGDSSGDAEVDSLVQLGARLRGAPDPAFKRWLKDSLMAMIPPARALGPAARIGVIADTHGRAADGSDLPQEVLDAFAGADLIVHCGDIGHFAVLDRLATVAPVLALRGAADLPTTDPRIVPSPHRLEAGGVRLGVVFDLVEAGAADEAGTVPSPDRLEAVFAGPVDVVVCAATHQELVASRAGVLLVNPGSPTLPAIARPGERGTVAVLDVKDGAVSVELVRLRKTAEEA